jgi:hypothetical protein
VAMAEAAAEGVPPGALSESEIFAQAAKRKEAAVEELTRLQLRVQCVADAYLCSTLHDRCSQVRAAPARCCAPNRPRLVAAVVPASVAPGRRAADWAEARSL